MSNCVFSNVDHNTKCWNCCGGPPPGCRPSRCCCCRRFCDSRPFITLCGVVTGQNGAPLVNQPVQFTINHVSNTVNTNAQGRYTVVVLHGTRVTIKPLVGLGVTVAPPERAVTATLDRCDLGFVLSNVLTQVCVSGRVRGLCHNGDVPICYWINGEEATTHTDCHGCYRICAPYGANVIIRAQPQRCYRVCPQVYHFERLTEDVTGRDFWYKRIHHKGTALEADDEADDEAEEEADDEAKA